MSARPDAIDSSSAPVAIFALSNRARPFLSPWATTVLVAPK
jgi:hypothetical protein